MYEFLRKDHISSINVNELNNLLGKVNLIDIREPYEYKNGHLPTAVNIPMNKLVTETEKYLDKAKAYHIICQSGARSSRTCGVLKDKGFNVINISGGTGGYRGALEK